MAAKIGFLGHGIIQDQTTVYRRLVKEIDKYIRDGSKQFYYASEYGDFCGLCSQALDNAKRSFDNISIISVTGPSLSNTQLQTIYSEFKAQSNNSIYSLLHLVDFQTASFQRAMIDWCDVLVCYIDEKRNDPLVKTSLKYALEKGLKIVNLFNENDI